MKYLLILTAILSSLLTFSSAYSQEDPDIPRTPMVVLDWDNNIIVHEQGILSGQDAILAVDPKFFTGAKRNGLIAMENNIYSFADQDALAQFDANEDSIIDEGDAIYQYLYLIHFLTSGKMKVVSLKVAGIRAIILKGHEDPIKSASQTAHADDIGYVILSSNTTLPLRIINVRTSYFRK